MHILFYHFYMYIYLYILCPITCAHLYMYIVFSQEDLIQSMIPYLAGAYCHLVYSCERSVTNMSLPSHVLIQVAICITTCVAGVLFHTECSDPLIHRVVLDDNKPTYHLMPFPENALCLHIHVNVTHTHPYLCHWIINNTQAADEPHRDFVHYADGFSLVIQPFGQHFYNTTCRCLFTETGATYTVIIGRPCKWNECEKKKPLLRMVALLLPCDWFSFQRLCW